jgi:hypothetical protein
MAVLLASPVVMKPSGTWPGALVAVLALAALLSGSPTAALLGSSARRFRVAQWLLLMVVFVVAQPWATSAGRARCESTQRSCPSTSTVATNRRHHGQLGNRRPSLRRRRVPGVVADDPCVIGRQRVLRLPRLIHASGR